MHAFQNSRRPFHCILFAICISASLPLGSQASVFVDAFDRPDTAHSDHSAEKIGSVYQLIQGSGERRPSVAIMDGTLRLHQLGSGETARDVLLVHRDLPLEKRFAVAAKIKTVDVQAAALLYGLVFNAQANGAFYAVRINTGNPKANLQLIYRDPQGNIGSIGVASSGQALQTETTYELQIISNGPGQLDYRLIGPGLDGGQLEGSFKLPANPLTGGYAGIYASTTNTSIAFDDLRIETAAE